MELFAADRECDGADMSQVYACLVHHMPDIAVGMAYI